MGDGGEPDLTVWEERGKGGSASPGTHLTVGLEHEFAALSERTAFQMNHV